MNAMVGLWNILACVVSKGMPRTWSRAWRGVLTFSAKASCSCTRSRSCLAATRVSCRSFWDVLVAFMLFWKSSFSTATVSCRFVISWDCREDCERERGTERWINIYSYNIWINIHHQKYVMIFWFNFYQHFQVWGYTQQAKAFNRTWVSTYSPKVFHAAKRKKSHKLRGKRICERGRLLHLLISPASCPCVSGHSLPPGQSGHSGGPSEPASPCTSHPKHWWPGKTSLTSYHFEEADWILPQVIHHIPSD